MLKQQCLQGTGAQRQTAAGAQRTITMPQRPSRLDPSSERGRAAYNGLPLPTLIYLLLERLAGGSSEIGSQALEAPVLEVLASCAANRNLRLYTVPTRKVGVSAN